VTAGDINLTQTSATSIFNVTATGAGVLGFGLGLDITAGGLLLINSAGNVSIGSGNVLGADTEIEKVGFKENEIYKAGADDLEIRDVSSINGFKYIPTQQWSAVNASTNVNMNGFDINNAMTVSTNQLRGQAMTLVGPPGTTSYLVGAIGSSSNLTISASSTLSLEAQTISISSLNVSSMNTLTVSSLRGNLAQFSTIGCSTIAFDRLSFMPCTSSTICLSVS
jgi:hypothetical protein